jgi:Caspase domain
LYALAISVSDSKQDAYDLRYAHKDAEGFQKALAALKGRPFHDVQVQLVTDAKATKNEIMRKFAWLKSHLTKGDLVIVTVSGHGTKDFDDEFFFLPHDYDKDDELRNSGVSWGDFTKYLKILPCASIVVMDTCHSGEITKDTRGGGQEDLNRGVEMAVRALGDIDSGVGDDCRVVERAAGARASRLGARRVNARLAGGLGWRIQVRTDEQFAATPAARERRSDPERQKTGILRQSPGEGFGRWPTVHRREKHGQH